MIKLVRDKIPALVAAKKDNIYKCIPAPKKKMLSLLKDKLLEETTEVSSAPIKKDIVEGMADVLEVLYALCDELDISFGTLQETRYNKKVEQGGFSGGWLIPISSEE